MTAWRLLFDLDGTLVDSAPAITAALARFLEEAGRPALAEPQVRLLIGDGAPVLVERALALTGAPAAGETLATEIRRYVAILEQTPLAPDAAYPGVAETLAALRGRGWPLALVTNKPAGATRQTLRWTGLDGLFDAVQCGDSGAGLKPSPGPLLAALGRLAPADRAAMIGDNAHDVAAAHAAGLPAIAVAYGYPRMPLADLGADLVIDRFADLPAALERL